MRRPRHIVMDRLTELWWDMIGTAGDWIVKFFRKGS